MCAEKSLQEQLDSLNCPFTWEMKDIILCSVKKSLDDANFTEENFVPLFGIVIRALNIYRKTVEEKFEEAEENFGDLKSYYTNMTRKNKGSETFKSVLKVSKYIVDSTHCHFLNETKKLEGLEEKVKPLLQTKFEDEELGMLLGCKALAWSLYGGNESTKTAEFARKAIEKDPKNGMWYFILGKSLRRVRRASSVAFSEEEKTAFKKSFHISPNPLTGIFLAQMYRECRDRGNTKNMYLGLYNMNINHPYILLRIALGLTRCYLIEEASDCLEKAKPSLGETSMFLHYSGILLEKTKKYRRAAELYKQAGEKGNFASDMSYLQINQKMNREYNPLPHLLSMLDRYKEGLVMDRQSLLLHIAHVYMKKGDLEKAVEYFESAKDVNDTAPILKNYRDYEFKDSYNVFEKLEQLREQINQKPTQKPEKNLNELLENLSI